MELFRHVREAINTLYERDSALFTLGASEWSIAHRLAVYLEQRVSGWNVDCEYNRQGPVPNVPKPNAAGSNVRPDIVLHHRGRMEVDHNFLVIELKCKDDDHDPIKVADYTSAPNQTRKYQYQYGLVLSQLASANGPSLEWYSGGVVVGEATVVL